jgi:3-oxoadipate enol-lactonase
VLGHERVGSGPRCVFVLNDWLCDTSTWDEARVYFDQTRFSWAFTDLRGYGRSRGLAGSCTVLEAAGDVLALADRLGWPRFAVVGHSMSTCVAMHLAQHAPDRVERVVLVAPVPPRGLGADDAWLASSQALARDEARRAEMVKHRFAARLSPGWGEYKTRRWLATSDAEAAARYIAMFARDGLPTPDAAIAVPVLAITGEEDAPALRKDAALTHLAPLCAELEVAALVQSGHYPMQEMPPLTAALVERFLGA